MNIFEMTKGARELILRGIDEEKRTAVFRGVTEQVAADGGILDVDGADFGRLETNPSFQWAHSGEVIGRIIDWVTVTKDRAIDFTVEFPAQGISDFADSKWRMVQAGFIRACSIGFRINSFADLTDKEKEAKGLSRYGWLANDWEVHELSLCAVGADPGAIKRALASGAILAADLEDVTPEPEPSLLPYERGQAKREQTNSAQELRDLYECITATNAEHVRAQVTMQNLTDEIAGLTEFLRAADRVEPESVPDRNRSDGTAADDTNANDDDIATLLGDVVTLLKKKGSK